jgi:hypothetical protein
MASRVAETTHPTNEDLLEGSERLSVYQATATAARGYRWCDKYLERERSKRFMRGDHARELAGDPHGASSVEAGVVATRGRGKIRVVLGADAARAGLTVIECAGLTRLLDEDQHEATAADAAGVRAGHRECEGGGDRGVDRVSARLKDLDAGFAGEL